MHRDEHIKLIILIIFLKYNDFKKSFHWKSSLCVSHETNRHDTKELNLQMFFYTIYLSLCIDERVPWLVWLIDNMAWFKEDTL